MSNQRKSAKEIYLVALEINSIDQRYEYVDQICCDTPEVRREVNALLRSHELGKTFEEPTIDAVDVGHHAEPAEGRGFAPTIPPDPDRKTEPFDAISRQLPRRFGDYELLSEIAHGGMGVVYKARQVSLNRIVALKMIVSGQLASEDEVKRFLLEAESAAHLDHPGIVPVFDVGCWQGQHFFSMGFVDGQSLSAVIQKGRVSPRQAANYVRKIALAAHAAHTRGIVHRDLKPGNVLLDQNDEPKVTDFGLAKRVEGASDLTATGVVIGTPCFMPPEQAAGKLDQITALADVYSLGAILYALLTGRPPFQAQTQIETLMRVLQEEPIPPRHLVASIPKDLEVICLKCLEKNPTDRYGTANDLAVDLQQFLAGEPIGAKNDFRRRFRKWTIREPVLASHMAATVVMMTVIFINYLTFSGSDQRSWHLLLYNQAILFVWCTAVFVLQKAQNRLKTRFALPLAWASANPVFLTIVLGVNPAPRGSLFSLYLLLLVITCFFRRIELVTVTTISSLVGYLVLLALFFEEESSVTPSSYFVVFGITMIVSGLLLGMLALRLNRLSQQQGF